MRVTASIGLSAVIWLCGIAYWNWQPDELALLHLCPRWVWLVSGVGILVISVHRRYRRIAGIILVAWIVAGLGLVEELTSLGRGLLTGSIENVDRENGLRAITLNCGSGGSLAVKAALRNDPDVLFLQESPSKGELESLATDHFGQSPNVVWSPDSAIVSRFPVVRESTVEGFCFVRCDVKHPTAGHLRLVSLRLQPPAIRLDVWRAACWRQYADVRAKHRAELREVLATGVLPHGANDLLIVAGDFNLVAADPALQVLPAWLQDAFPSTGTGWGNTIVSDFPIHRIDQIWTTKLVSPYRMHAVFTKHSDHRMTIADLTVSKVP